MPDPDRFLARLRRRLFWGEVLRVGAGWLAAFLLVFGGALLAGKLFGPRYLPAVYGSSAALLPLLALVAWRASRSLPSGREAVALLDSRVGAGGLLMTLSERTDPRWRRKLPPADAWADALPKLRPVRFTKAVAVPALFAAGAAFVPLREEPSPPAQVAAGTDAARELAETFELLEQASAFDEETRVELEEELEDLAAEAAEKPLTHEKWETIDALRERMRSSLAAAALTVSKGRSAAAVLGATAVAARPLAADRSEELSRDLAGALEMLRKNGAFAHAASQALGGIPPEVQQLLKAGDFQLPSDPAVRREALEHLAALLDGEQKRLAAARDRAGTTLGGLLSPGDLLAQLETGFAGPGGDVELSFGREPEEQATKFKETVLPRGFFDRPNEQAAGVTASTPRVDLTTAGPRNAVRDSPPVPGGATWDRSIRPRHRDVVRRYFDDG